MRSRQMTSTMRAFAPVALAVALSATAAAQWIDYKTPGVPRLPDGRPNLSAPAPRAVRAVAARATAPDPAARYASVPALSADVARFLDGTLDFPGIAGLLETAVARHGGSAGDADPGLDELVALDAEVRRSLAAGDARARA